MSDSPPPVSPDPAASPGPAAAPRRARLHTEAVQRRGRWPGLVWAIPLAALLVVIYLGIQGLANRGFDVVVTFKTSGGARAGETPVVYKGVTVGHVVKIQIAKDIADVEMTLRMEPGAREHIREGTKFWLIGAEPSLTDLNSLKSAISGVSIGVSPGGGAPQRRFVGLDQPPAVPPDTPGALYVLEGGYVGSTRVGSGVYYHGLLAGRVTRVHIQDPQTLRLVVFINAPFDKLVRPHSLFFNANAASIALAAGNVSAMLGPGSSVITGGFEFDTPATTEGEPQSPAHAVFHFYPNKAEAADQPQGPQVRYRAVFRAASGRLQPDAPVMLSGQRIGRVLDAHLVLQKGATEPRTEVNLEIEPHNLGLAPADDPRAATDAALRDLIRGGYRLSFGQDPPLVGSATLVLQRGATHGRASLSSGDEPELPTAGSSSLGDLTSTASSILDKVNSVPIEAIGQDVRQITSHLNTLVSSPQLSDSLQHLDGTLNQVDQMMAQVKPQVGPLIAKLNQAADQLNGAAGAANSMLSGQGAGQDASLPDAIRQLNEAARSIRTLTDYLGRHPEAVVRGRPKDGS